MSPLERIMPVYHVRSAHEIRIDATPESAYDALLSTDFTESRIVRGLLRLRRFGRKVERSRNAGSLLEHVQRAGFLVLAQEPGRYVVAGIAGRFWLPNSGIVFGLRVQDFFAFREIGFAKATWLFEVLPAGSGASILRTETRIQCFGRSAERRFRAYWFVVGPFSGLIRRAMLRLVKRRAENTGNIKV
jgi:hypothetical protein